MEEKYPTATIERVETDSDGVYEAHILDGGRPLTVAVGTDFTLTGTQQGPGGTRGAGGHGDHDGDGPGQGTSSEAPPAQEG